MTISHSVHDSISPVWLVIHIHFPSLFGLARTGLRQIPARHSTRWKGWWILLLSSGELHISIDIYLLYLLIHTNSVYIYIYIHVYLVVNSPNLLSFLGVTFLGLHHDVDSRSIFYQGFGALDRWRWHDFCECFGWTVSKIRATVKTK